MKYSDNDNYPEVYLPSYIEKIYTLEEVIVDTPPNPPDPPSKEVTPKFNFNLIVVILVFSMLIVGLTSLITTNDIILIVSVVLSIAYFISQCRKEISEHRNRIISIEERYKEALLSHPLALKEYDEDLERWKIWLEKTSKNYKEEAEKSRRGELLKAHQITAMPSSRSKDVKKGRAESLFANYLHHFLPRRIYIDHSFDTTEDNNPYTPDMIYYNKKTHIGCVIEIDEPYSARDLIPIHYLYDESYSNGDGIRNTYFTKRGWSVLRFAEEQVVTNPKGCLDYLIELLCYLGESGLESKLPGRSLQEVKCWTYEEASVMAEDRYRETYLKNWNLEIVHQKSAPKNNLRLTNKYRLDAEEYRFSKHLILGDAIVFEYNQAPYIGYKSSALNEIPDELPF